MSEPHLLIIHQAEMSIGHGQPLILEQNPFEIQEGLELV